MRTRKPSQCNGYLNRLNDKPWPALFDQLNISLLVDYLRFKRKAGFPIPGLISPSAVSSGSMQAL